MFTLILFSPRFNEVVEIRNEEVLSRIHMNYRILYLKDVILLRHIEESTSASLGSMLFINNVHIISKLAVDENFLDSLFSTLAHVLVSYSHSSRKLLCHLVLLTIVNLLVV